MILIFKYNILREKNYTHNNIHNIHKNYIYSYRNNKLSFIDIKKIIISTTLYII